MITDAIGRAVAFVLAPGQDHELPHAIPLLDKLPGVPKWMVADRGYSSHAFREHICVPPPVDETSVISLRGDGAG